MHDNEWKIDEPIVRGLIKTEFPDWAELPLKALSHSGTDHAIYRLGDKLCVRLPRIEEAIGGVEKEQRWLSVLAPGLAVKIPEVVGVGEPSDEYPGKWSVCKWIEGKSLLEATFQDEVQFAKDLALFIKELQRVPVTEGPRSRRAGLLSSQDDAVRNAIDQLGDKIDAKQIAKIWEACLAEPVWENSPVWTHGDLLPGNILVKDKRLVGVIDFGLCGVGDPACDMIAGWSVFSEKGREAFRKELGIDDATWKRGRGWALSIALIILPYYEKTNPGLVGVAERILAEILSERG